MKNVYSTLFLILIVGYNSLSAQNIVINEILTSNTTVNVDEDGDYADWVELYNTGTTTINLDGYGLTDDSLLPYKWTFPDVSLAAGQHLLIYCDDKDISDPTQPLHANFKISSSGEVITLTNAVNVTLDFVPATVIAQNTSFGRLPNGTGNFTFINAPTPNTTNSQGEVQEALSPPTFSKDSGFLTAGFNLTLSTTVVGATILYTLDGSEPQFSNLGGTTYSYKNQYQEISTAQAIGSKLTKSFKTLQYSTPIVIADRSSQPNKIATISTTFDFNPTYIPASPIYKGTVVRAKVIKAGILDSPTVTRIYYISPLGANRFSLPVLSLSIDENKLFDYNTGIAVAGADFDNWRTTHPSTDATYEEDNANYYRKGRDYERTANMSYIVNGVEALNQDIGIRIHGGTTRATRSKSFNLYARSEYGNSNMNYKFFSNLTESNFNKLVLRNSGGDFIHTMFRDALSHTVVRSLHCITESYQPTISFINGEYNGILNLREKYDDEYFTKNFNIASNELDYLSDQGDTNLSPADYGDSVHYQAMLSYLNTNSMSTLNNYNYIKTQMDTESFNDYHITNIYLQNVDWPGTNIEFWRKRTASYEPNAPYGQDGRWRWAFHDLDDTFALPTDDIGLNTLALATAPNGPEYPNPAWSTFILRKLLVSPVYKNEFINRFADLMNTTFLASRVVGLIDSMKSTIEPEILEHIGRWKMPVEKDDWEYYLDQERDFANQRAAFQRNHIRSQFAIASNINATLNVSDVNAGYIKMNTIEVKEGTDGITSNPYPWTGVYFSNIPVTLKAIAKPGFVFSKWTGASTSTNPEITITSTASFNVTAVFVAETVASSQPIYYWMMNSDITNNLTLTSLNSTFKSGSTSTDGTLQFESSLTGYPFADTDANYGHASMERRNNPTDINYIPEANNNLDFASSSMKGLQVKEPLQNGSLENTMVFNFSTSGYKDIKLSFAAVNEKTNATAIAVDYAVNNGTPVWLTSSSLSLTDAYQLYNVDFSNAITANNNPNFKVRLRFTGTGDMTTDAGNRITFNNIAVFGTQTPLAVASTTALKFSIYPNPFSDVVNILGINQVENVVYNLFTVDGKWIKKGKLEENHQINLTILPKGLYLLQLTSNGKTETKKIIKK